MTVATLSEKVTAGDSVRRWRVKELRRAGYGPADALILSGRPDIDLHVAIGLLKRGCPPWTAVQILL